MHLGYYLCNEVSLFTAITFVFNSRFSRVTTADRSFIRLPWGESPLWEWNTLKIAITAISVWLSNFFLFPSSICSMDDWLEVIQAGDETTGNKNYVTIATLIIFYLIQSINTCRFFTWHDGPRVQLKSQEKRAIKVIVAAPSASEWALKSQSRRVMWPTGKSKDCAVNSLPHPSRWLLRMLSSHWLQHVIKWNRYHTFTKESIRKINST